jgi:hypothetical protein
VVDLRKRHLKVGGFSAVPCALGRQHFSPPWFSFLSGVATLWLDMFVVANLRSKMAASRTCVTSHACSSPLAAAARLKHTRHLAPAYFRPPPLLPPRHVPPGHRHGGAPQYRLRGAVHRRHGFPPGCGRSSVSACTLPVAVSSCCCCELSCKRGWLRGGQCWDGWCLLACSLACLLASLLACLLAAASRCKPLRRLGVVLACRCAAGSSKGCWPHRLCPGACSHTSTTALAQAPPPIKQSLDVPLPSAPLSSPLPAACPLTNTFLTTPQSFQKFCDSTSSSSSSSSYSSASCLKEQLGRRRRRPECRRLAAAAAAAGRPSVHGHRPRGGAEQPI